MCKGGLKQQYLFQSTLEPLTFIKKVHAWRQRNKNEYHMQSQVMEGNENGRGVVQWSMVVGLDARSCPFTTILQKLVLSVRVMLGHCQAKRGSCSDWLARRGQGGQRGETTDELSSIIVTGFLERQIESCTSAKRCSADDHCKSNYNWQYVRICRAITDFILHMSEFPRSRTIRTYRVCWGPLQTRKVYK